MVLVASAVLFASTGGGEAATAPSLATAQSFAVLAGAGITNTGPTTITGDVGSFPTTTQTGFASVTLNGANHTGDAVTQSAKNDLVTAYNNAAGQSPATTIPTELGGTSLIPGVYTSSAGTFGMTGTLTLNGQGDPNAVFIFQMATTLTTASLSNVNLIGSAQACNIFWQVGSSATLGTNSHFNGNILALTSITLTTGANVVGRVLARNGAVTLDTNTITAPTCAVTPTSTATATQSFSPSNVTQNGTSTLTITVTNPNASTPLSGVGFTDNFPAGLVIATPSGLSGSCGGGTITATAGGATFSLGGATLAGGALCTISVTVQALQAGSLVNTTGSIASSAGNGTAASATLVVSAVPLVIIPTPIIPVFQNPGVGSIFNAPPPRAATPIQPIAVAPTQGPVGPAVIIAPPNTGDAGLRSEIDLVFD